LRFTARAFRFETRTKRLPCTQFLATNRAIGEIKSATRSAVNCGTLRGEMPAKCHDAGQLHFSAGRSAFFPAVLALIDEGPAICRRPLLEGFSSTMMS
jgi:hypothetical protein